MYGQSLPPAGVHGGGYPQLRQATGGSLSLPGAAPGAPRSMGSLPAPSAAVRASASPASQGMVRVPSGSLSASPTSQGVVRMSSGSLGPTATSPNVVQNASLAGGTGSRGGSMSMRPATISNPTPQAVQSLGPGNQGGLGKKSTPFASMPASQGTSIARPALAQPLAAQPLSSQPPLSYRSDRTMPSDPGFAAPQPMRPQWASSNQEPADENSGSHSKVPSLAPLSRDERSPSPDLPVSHRYPQARIEARQSPSMPHLEPKVEADRSLSPQPRPGAAGFSVWNEPSVGVAPAPAMMPPSPPLSPRQQKLSVQQRQYEEPPPIVVQTRHREPHYSMSTQHVPIHQAHISSAAPQVIPSRQPAPSLNQVHHTGSVTYVETPPKQVGGFLSSISSDPVSAEKQHPQAFRGSPPSSQSQHGSASNREQQRGIEFAPAPKPIWQRDEVVAPVILTVPLAGFLSTMLF